MHKFYGHEKADVKPIQEEYRAVKDPRMLYDILSDIWCAETCASRMRDRWTPDNKTLGQCSITAFLVQDIFGGKVYGIPLPDGGVHCYNSVDGCTFDLTSEQFGDEVLDYTDNPEQFREVHFGNPEKQERYTLLKNRFEKMLHELMYPASAVPSLTTLCYLEQDGKYLMLRRNKKENDLNKDKYLGVGGHFKFGESPDECLIREVFEETGFTLTSYRARGIITFVYDNGSKSITEYMHLYTADGFTGELCECDEGELVWIDKNKVYDLPIWEGDKVFFRLLAQDSGFFTLKLVYSGDDLVSSSFHF